jgi:integrase
MKQKYRLFRLNSTGIFFLQDRRTGRQESLQTRDSDVAQRLLHARNETHQQPLLNIQIGRAYLAATDPAITKRTWQTVMDESGKTKEGETLVRWQRAIKDHAFDLIRHLVILETRPEHFLKVLERGTVATNVFLRRLHNFALNMSWLPWPVVPRQQWPKVRFKEKRAITFAEHADIVERERNPEKRAFYQLLWHLGGSQGDIASLAAEDIDWVNRVISYRRRKTNQIALLHFGDQVQAVLRTLPTTGPLFPYLRTLRASDRATEFKQRCRGLRISGITLHSYRYAWAERAKAAGYPERYAMEALGHNSMAVHRAYAKNAQFKLPALEEYETSAVQRMFPYLSMGVCGVTFSF